MKTREIIITLLLVAIAFLVGFNWDGGDNDELIELKAQIKALDQRYTEISLRTEKWKRVSDSLSVVLREKDSIVVVKNKQLATTKWRHSVEIKKYKKDVISFSDDSLSLEWKATVGDSSDSKKIFKIPRLQVENAVVIFKEYGNCLEEAKELNTLVGYYKDLNETNKTALQVKEGENISLRGEVKILKETNQAKDQLVILIEKDNKKQKRLKKIFLATAVIIGGVAIIK